MTTSKEQILTAVRRNRPAAAELPPPLTPPQIGEGKGRGWTSYANRREQFIAMLESVGGQALVARGRADLIDKLHGLPVYAEMRKIVSLVPGIDSLNFDWSAIDSPHALDDVDLAIVPGEFAVAENAAVWVTDRDVPQRVLYFLCQHLVLVVPAIEIVDHMHAAYERLTGGGAFAEPRFGAFISGPSKTADIEQCLVIGAHGPRSLTVCLIEE